MEYRQLGRSGVRVSCLCLGTMNFGVGADEAASIRVVHEAIELGINFIDTANVYERGVSEEIVGKALADGGRRDKVVLATKAVASMGDGPNDHGASRYHLVRQCEESLRRLRTDRIDLYQLHVVDPTTPLDETLRSLDMLVQQGKVCYIGTSKYPVTLIMEGIAISEREGLERFVSEQPPYNLLDRSIENELLWMCLRHGVGVIPWAPLATGILAGRYRPGESPPPDSRFAGAKPDNPRLTPAAIEAVEKLRPLAGARGVTMAQFSLAWLLSRPGVTAPILGARTVEHVTSGVKACDIKLTQEELDEIDKIVPPGTWVSNYYDGNVYGRLRQDVNARI